jgi:hypothetical protein
METRNLDGIEFRKSIPPYGVEEPQIIYNYLLSGLEIVNCQSPIFLLAGFGIKLFEVRAP